VTPHNREVAQSRVGRSFSTNGGMDPHCSSASIPTRVIPTGLSLPGWTCQAYMSALPEGSRWREDCV